MLPTRTSGEAHQLHMDLSPLTAEHMAGGAGCVQRGYSIFTETLMQCQLKLSQYQPDVQCT